jgi:hypothetical protein
MNQQLRAVPDIDTELTRMRRKRLRREGKTDDSHDIDPRKDIPPVESADEFVREANALHGSI